MKRIALVICVAVLAVAPVCAESAHAVKVLAVLRAHEATKHFRPPIPEGQIVFASQPPLNASYRSALDDFDRDTPLRAALTLAFRDRAPFVELTTTTNRERYMGGTLLDKPTRTARAEGFDFVIVLYDDFIGFAPRDYVDDDSIVVAPEYAFSYALYEVAADKMVRRGYVQTHGYEPVTFDGSARDRELFARTWPYLCLMSAVDMLDELVREDAVHAMSVHAGLGAEYPAVREEIKSYGKRLAWHLEPASGWREQTTGSTFSRILAPRGKLSRQVRMYVNAELLLPALGQQARSIEEFASVYDRDRARVMPDSPMTPFSNVDAPNYRAWRLSMPSGQQQLVFMRKTSRVTMQVVTVRFDGTFDDLYPAVRGKIEQMLAHSTVSLDQ